MTAESMVDALHKIKTLLKPGGRLIDIHPQHTALPLYVRLGATTHQVGVINVASKIAKYRRASTAINTVLQTGSYTLQAHKIVDYFVYFDTVAACRQYLAEEWHNAHLPQESWQKMTALMRADADFKQIYYVEAINYYDLAPANPNT